MTNALTTEDQAYYKLFGEKIVKNILAVPEYVREMDLGELEEGFNPSYNLYQLKLVFWKKFYEASQRKLTFELNDVIRESRVTPYLFNKTLKDPIALWWLLSPTADYEDQMEALLYKALKAESDILGMKTTKYSRDGDPIGEDAALVRLKQAQIKDIKDRVVGPVSSKIESKSVNVHSNSPRSLKNITPEPSDIDAELQNLRLQNNRQKGVFAKKKQEETNELPEATTE